jgi:hypothetical protein
VIDIGGFTTNWVAVNPGGEVYYSLARSVPLGMQSVIQNFEESFRANNLKAVKDTPVLTPERVRKAISSGFFEGGGKKYPCEVRGSRSHQPTAEPGGGYVSAYCRRGIGMGCDYPDWL